MDDFDFSDYFDLIDESLPAAPEEHKVLHPVAIQLPDGVQWAKVPYNIDDLKKEDHLTAYAYHVTEAELKHFPHKNLWLLLVQTHVGEEKHWYNTETKMNKNFDSLIRVFGKPELEVGFIKGNWVQIRQVLEYPRWVAVVSCGCYRAEDAKHIVIETEESWNARQDEYESRYSYSGDYDDYMDDWHPGHPSNYGDR